MEHIQCPHCKKKYGANDKIRAAVGKKIRCKHCQEIFEIVIQQAGNKQEIKPDSVEKPAASKETAEPQVETSIPDENSKEEETASEKKVARKQKKKVVKKKGINVQLTITIVLAAILLIGGITALLYFNNPELFKQAPKKETSRIIKPLIPDIDPFSKSISPEPASQKSVQAVSKKTEADTPQTTAPENTNSVPVTDVEKASAKPGKNRAPSLLDGPKKPTQVCKDAAADQWIRTHKLSHSQMSTKTYMRLFNQGVGQTAEVRKLCKGGTSLVVRLTAAAKEEKIPDWIRTEIEARAQIDAARKKQIESTGR